MKATKYHLISKIQWGDSDMRVGKSKKANATCIRRSEASLNHAIRKIKESGIAPYVRGI